MEAVLRLTTRVQPGGKIEITDSQLPAGNLVDLLVLFPQPTDSSRRSVVDIIAEAPGHLAFQNSAEADAYIQEERDAWKRF